MSTAEPTAPRRRLLPAILGTALHGVLVVGLMAMFVTTVPGIKKTCDEYGITLPWISLLVFRVANFAADFWWTAVPLLPLAGVADFLVMRFASRSASVTWLIGVTLLLFALIGVTIAAIEMPMATLRKATS